MGIMVYSFLWVMQIYIVNRITTLASWQHEHVLPICY